MCAAAAQKKQQSEGGDHYCYCELNNGSIVRHATDIDTASAKAPTAGTIVGCMMEKIKC